MFAPEQFAASYSGPIKTARERTAKTKRPGLIRAVLFFFTRNCRRSCDVGNTGCGGGRARSFYQITTCLSPLRTMPSPALHWKALAKAGMFDGAPSARNMAG